MEIWKDIQGYEGRYQISNYGRVKSLNYHRERREVILMLKKTRTGYLVIGLRDGVKKKFFSVHKLVAMAFIPPYNGEQVNHIDATRLITTLKILNGVRLRKTRFMLLS